MQKKHQWALMIILAAIGFIAALAYNTMSYSAFRVEVCMDFEGRTDCRTALAATEELALRAAIDNACALISSGMTKSMACTSTQPKSIKWLKGK